MREGSREEHRASGFPRSYLVHFFRRELLGGSHHDVAIQPFHLGANAFQYLNNAVDLFYFWYALDGRRPAIEKRCRKECDRSILRNVRRDRARELFATNDLVVHIAEVIKMPFASNSASL